MEKKGKVFIQPVINTATTIKTLILTDDEGAYEGLKLLLSEEGNVVKFDTGNLVVDTYNYQLYLKEYGNVNYDWMFFGTVDGINLHYLNPATQIFRTEEELEEFDDTLYSLTEEEKEQILRDYIENNNLKGDYIITDARNEKHAYFLPDDPAIRTFEDLADYVSDFYKGKVE